MRKKLLFCSALLLSASLAGCGYNDDNVRETVPALPESCSSTNECFVGSVGGVCVEGHCLRACEDKTDCEDGTICESGLCRHIVPCPTMDFTDDYRKFQNSKCLKVFSHTPSTNWVSLLKQDVTLNSVSSLQPSTNFTSNNFTFQIPQRSLLGGLNYSLVIAATLTFIILEQMSSNLLLQCMVNGLGLEEHKFNINMDSSANFKLNDNSLYEVCQSIETMPWINFASKAKCTTQESTEAYNDRFVSSKRTTNADAKTYIQRCNQAYLAWQTLDKVYKVISEATLGDHTRTPTYHAIKWVLDFLNEGIVKTTTTLSNDYVDDKDLKLPLINSCEDIVDNAKKINTTICYDIMNSIYTNTMTQVIGKSNMDFVRCLTEESTATSLVTKGWDLVDLIKPEDGHTLIGIAQTLIGVLASGNASLAENFKSMDGMVRAIGDPTFIWLTENNFQELNIISNQTSNNPFSKNTLMLGINYKPKSREITSTKVQLDVYDANTKATNKKIGTQQYMTEDINTTYVASLLSESVNGHYEFYFNPTIDAGKTLTCGGVVLDISSIDGYVVLTDDQINSMNGTALIVETPK